MVYNIDYTFCPPIAGNYVDRERPIADIQYLVFHYTANPGSSARANAEYYGTSPTGGVGAHYFIDETSIYASTPERCRAGSVGKWQNSVYYTNACNDTTVNIELCCKSLLGKKAAELSGWGDNDIYFEQGTIDRAIALARDIIERYSIPKERMIRHFDVFGKIGDPSNLVYRKPCPRPFVGDDLNIYYHRTGNELFEIFRDFIYSNNTGQLNLIYDIEPDPSYDVWVGEVVRVPFGDTLNVRQYANASAPLIDGYPKLANGNRVEIIGERISPDGRIWYKIKIQGTFIGYVNAVYIMPISGSFVGVVHDARPYLNVRTSPEDLQDRNIYQHYSRLGNGNLIRIIGQVGNWYRIRIEDLHEFHIAYAHKNYIERNE